VFNATAGDSFAVMQLDMLTKSLLLIEGDVDDVSFLCNTAGASVCDGSVVMVSIINADDCCKNFVFRL
jgi:hypothetical protein